MFGKKEFFIRGHSYLTSTFKGGEGVGELKNKKVLMVVRVSGVSGLSRQLSSETIICNI